MYIYIYIYINIFIFHTSYIKYTNTMRAAFCVCVGDSRATTVITLNLLTPKM